MRIVSYNLIAHPFTDGTSKYIVESAYTHSSVRYPICARQFGQMIHEDPSTIFCLQEWGCSQMSYFGPMFVENGYLIFASLGGKADRDCNSTAIAIPVKYYDARILKIAMNKEITKPTGENIKLDPRPVKTYGRNLADNCYEEALLHNAELIVAEL